MAPIDSKLKGLLPETRYQFQGIRIRQNHKWITKVPYFTIYLFRFISLDFNASIYFFVVSMCVSKLR